MIASPRFARRRSLCAMGLFAPLLPHGPIGSAAAHDGHAAPKALPPATGVKLRLKDTPLIDQDGRPLRLRTDVLGDRIAVVNFVYTSCTTVCPVASATMAHLQQELGPLAGPRVRLLTISIDPQRDSPARLKEQATRHRAGAGWLWLTGRKADVDDVLRSFGAYTSNPDDHPPLTLIGDDVTGRWTRLYGFPGVMELQAHLQQALARQPTRGG